MLTYADNCDSGRSAIRENAICARGIGFSGLPHEKCSDDFLAKPLICLWSTIDSAQVGLARTEALARRARPAPGRGRFAKNACSVATTCAPSPTAAATRLTELDRTSPMAN